MASAAPQLPPPPEADPEPRCLNCEAALSGPYCAQCGQKVHDFHISLWHLWDEFAEDYFHFESRLPRTLWYLVSRPGFLTREFLAGRRARYVGPFKLYLMASVIFFLSIGVVRPLLVHTDPPNPKARSGNIHIEPSKEEGSSTVDRFVEQRIKHRVDTESPEQLNNDVRQAILRYMPDAMLALVPVLALFFKLLYRKRFYAEHFVLALHLHAAGYLAMLVSELTPWGLVGFLSFLAFVVYALVSVRRVYQQGWLLTLFKSGLVGFAYTMALSGAVAAVVLGNLLFA